MYSSLHNKRNMRVQMLSNELLGAFPFIYGQWQYNKPHCNMCVRAPILLPIRNTYYCSRAEEN